jgi:hypothetical protein
MSFNNQTQEAYFGGQQGAEDGSTPGAQGAGPQGQMPQSMEGAGGQFNNMQVGGSGTGGESPDNKTTLWLVVSSSNIRRMR